MSPYKIVSRSKRLDPMPTETGTAKKRKLNQPELIPLVDFDFQKFPEQVHREILNKLSSNCDDVIWIMIRT